jgi:hypothetical protein
MEHPTFAASARNTGTQLEQAAGIRRQDKLGFRLLNPPHFILEKFFRQVVVNHVVNPGASTTDLRFL